MLTVGELARRLRQTLDASFPSGVWVSGEIDSISRPRSGHVYFNLVERPEEAPGAAPTAVVPVVLFRDDRQRVNTVIKRYGNAIRMADGVQVMVQAMLDFYPPRGRLQLRMISIDPAHTLGAVAAYRAAVLASLSEEGLLGRNAELALPAVPLRVGLVTSLGSAAHADIRRVLEASGLAFTVAEADTAVQGPEAPSAIAAAVAAAAEHGDVVLLARGGGSTTDLAAFDHELVARAVASCHRPVLTGIGHETDRSAADEMAHTSCSTPTAAARAVVRRVEDWLSQLDQTARSISHRGRRALKSATDRIDRAASDTARSGRASTRHAQNNLTDTAQRLNRAGQAAVERPRVRLTADAQRLNRAANHTTRQARDNLTDTAQRLNRAANLTTRQADQRLTADAQRLNRAGQAAVERPRVRLASDARRLARSGRAAERQAHSQLDQASARFALASSLDLRSAATRLDALEARVRALDPALLLRRGWSLTRRADGRLVRSTDDVATGESITTHLADGSLTSTIHARHPGHRSTADAPPTPTAEPPDSPGPVAPARRNQSDER